MGCCWLYPLCSAHEIFISSCLFFFPQGFLAPGEIDPLNRRFATVPKPDVVVQGEGKGPVPNFSMGQCPVLAVGWFCSPARPQPSPGSWM